MITKRCHYGCQYRNKCMGIPREEMIESLMEFDPELKLDNLTNNEIQVIADNYTDDTIYFDHIRETEE